MIFWIASYPKSGNTWLRALISTYFFSKDGTFYSASGMFLMNEGSEFLANENLFICQRKTDEDNHSVLNNSGPAQSNFFRIEWSRFGSINLYKWANDWVTQ